MIVAVTCIQLIRDLPDWSDTFAEHGLEVVVPSIPGQHLEGQELVNAVTGCVGVVAGDDKFTADVLEQLPDLRIISKWGSGIDGIDLEAAARLGIAVTNTPGMFDNEVADISMAYVTMLARDLVAINNGVHAGSWPKPAGRSLSDSTLGIVGLGGIGRALARRGIAANMRVVGFDPDQESQNQAEALGAELGTLDDVLAQSDFLSINCPLNSSTFHLIDASAFTKMRDGVRIVNTGRGPVIDTAALVEALANGKVAGAALDVLEEEPPAIDSPLLNDPRVVLGSHNASNTLEASARVHALAIQNLVDHLKNHSTS